MSRKRSEGRVGGLGDSGLSPAVEMEGLSLAVERLPIPRELLVVRVGPNPRMVLCEYWELASRRTCVVNVGKNRKWVRGMRIRMNEPVSEEEYRKPWVYRGAGPRRRGWPKEV